MISTIRLAITSIIPRANVTYKNVEVDHGAVPAPRSKIKTFQEHQANSAQPEVSLVRNAPNSVMTEHNSRYYCDPNSPQPPGWLSPTSLH